MYLLFVQVCWGRPTVRSGDGNRDVVVEPSGLMTGAGRLPWCIRCAPNHVLVDGNKRLALGTLIAFLGSTATG